MNRIPENIRSAIETLLDYLQDEEEDFAEHTRSTSHIFTSVSLLREWLDENE